MMADGEYADSLGARSPGRCAGADGDAPCRARSRSGPGARRDALSRRGIRLRQIADRAGFDGPASEHGKSPGRATRFPWRGPDPDKPAKNGGSAGRRPGDDISGTDDVAQSRADHWGTAEPRPTSAMARAIAPRRARERWSFSSGLVCPVPRRVWTSIRTSCPAVCASG